MYPVGIASSNNKSLSETPSASPRGLHLQTKSLHQEPIMQVLRDSVCKASGIAPTTLQGLRLKRITDCAYNASRIARATHQGKRMLYVKDYACNTSGIVSVIF
nr:hypothetical protein [Tanacetum cinerariifolium]